MKLTAKIKLHPTEEQRQVLHATLQRANAACNPVSDLAWQNKTFNKLALQKMCYSDVRGKFDLSAQMVIRALGRVADRYKRDKKTQRNLHKHGAFAYDSRILKYRLETQEVSIWTLQGRQIVGFEAGERQLERLQGQQGESALAFILGEFSVFAVCDRVRRELEDGAGYMGVDWGIVNIAPTDDGAHYSGKPVNRVRHRSGRMRRKLQKKGTKSAHRLLKKRTERGIALEALTGIRSRVGLCKSQRAQLHSWAFADLASKIAYKAEVYGVPMVYVDPRNTSRACSDCGQMAKGNRKTQDKLLCIACGFSAHADVNAAPHRGRRGAVNAPYADTA